MKSIKFCIYILFFVCLQAFSQNSKHLSSGEILHKLEKLNSIGSVLYIAAHPDDENTRLLAYMSNELKLRTAYLSVTRGDGGQNLIGKEQGEMLGLIRTYELLAARGTDGAEQYFTRANDFGYSKSPEETFRFWNKELVLADVVLAIRKFKPDVIICRFPTSGEGGHGHHTASAILAVEAFEAAADPNRFPEQLLFTQVWQAKRLFWNTFNFGATGNTTAPSQVKLDIGAYNVLLGKSYGEIAAESRSMHKSQGFGSASTRGKTIEYFKQLKGDSVKSVFENINLTWNRFESTSRFNKLLATIIVEFDAERPEKSVPALVGFYRKLKALEINDPEILYWKNQKLKETETLIVACSGLWVESCAVDYSGIPGQAIQINTSVINFNKCNVSLDKISYFSKTDTNTVLKLNTNELYTFRHYEKLPEDAPFSSPYWMIKEHGNGYYVVDDPMQIGNPVNKIYTKVVFDLTIEGLNLKLEGNLVYKYTDPVKGEIYRPFEILPPATINLSEKFYVFPDSSGKRIQLVIKANAKDVKGTVQINASSGWSVKIMKPEFNLAGKGDEALIDAFLYRTKSGETLNYGHLSAGLNISGINYNLGIHRIEYDHIPYQLILDASNASILGMDIKLRGNNIGYIPGAGDEIPSCLGQLGYRVTIITDDMFDHLSVYHFDAIVTGIRAYNTNARLQLHYEKLMKYVEEGGNLVVQYNTNSRVGPVVARIGPYPFTVSRNRVTDENAKVVILDSSHVALNFPNKISDADFDGWVQERGIYFASEIDSAYTGILSMNDPGEPANRGSLIISKYGKGNFVYTGLVFFRELPAGVPGAYKLFVNLLSLPKNKLD